MTDPVTRAVARRACTGCGACAALAPDAIRMVDVPSAGLRPVVAPGPAAAEAARRVAPACAGAATDRRALAARDMLDARWGPVLSVVEGHAADAEIRFRGSSGGAVTALALYLLEREGFTAVSHVAAADDDPRRNAAVLSADRSGLLRGAGSRYAPADACARLGDMASGEGRFAFVGKPCDVAAANAAKAVAPRLAERLGATIAIFCAGAPAASGTDALLSRLGMPQGARPVSVSYRGRGWPGPMEARWVTADGREETSRPASYGEGWGEVLEAHRPWRCRICTDHTGAFADISVGDPWHAPPVGEAEAGRSLIVARTERGRRIVEGALAAGYLVAAPRPRGVLDDAQPNLVDAHASAFGRRLAMRLAGLAVPAERGFPGLALWWRHLSARRRVQSVAGTLRRIARRRLWRPERVVPGGAE